MSEIIGGAGAKSGLVSNSGLGSPVQAWADYSSSRSSGTVYTNTTGRPIQVVASAALAHGHIWANINGGTDVYAGGYNNWTPTVAFIVPSGNTYEISASDGNVDRWQELR